MDRLDETSLRDATEGVEMSPERESRESDRPSGVHRRFGRVLVIEPDPCARGQWDAAREVHHVEFVSRPQRLTRALGLPGEARAVSVALVARYDLERRTAVVRELQGVGEVAEQRVIIDVRRCDLATAHELIDRGFILSADDELHRGTAARAAVNHTTMADQLKDSLARMRLAKTLAATGIADAKGLTPSEYRVLRGAMDFRQIAQLASAMALADSTLSTHRQRIANKAGVSEFEDLVWQALEPTFDIVYALGELRL